MVPIRLRFMDLLYAATIGNALQSLHPNTVDSAFIFGLFLILVILEDFFLYYIDVAPDNTSVEGMKFIGLICEASVLAFWYFAFSSFASHSWIFLFYLAMFFLIKTLAGLVNSFVEQIFFTLKCARELLFGISAATLFYFASAQHNSDDPISPQILALIAVLWLVQTVSWWGITHYANSRPVVRGGAMPGLDRGRRWINVVLAFRLPWTPAPPAPTPKDPPA